MGIRDKEKFYVFLDIDGVLWDWKWRINMIKEGKLKKGGLITNFNPKSVNALNTLIDYLNQNYICKLVISSTWRLHKDMTKSVLTKNGVDIVSGVDYTPISINPAGRGKEILTYLQDKENNDNILIIDDEYFDYPKYFKKCQFIKTDIFSSSLQTEQINNWIEINSIKNKDKFIM